MLRKTWLTLKKLAKYRLVKLLRIEHITSVIQMQCYLVRQNAFTLITAHSNTIPTNNKKVS